MIAAMVLLFVRAAWQLARPVPPAKKIGWTEIAFGALRAGAIDVYPEYTGTGLVAILGEEPSADRLAVFRSINHIYAQLVDDMQGVTLAAASSRGN